MSTSMNASWNVVCVINSFNVEFLTNNLIIFKVNNLNSLKLHGIYKFRSYDFIRLQINHISNVLKIYSIHSKFIFFLMLVTHQCYSLSIFMTSKDEETDKDGYIGKKVKEIGFVLDEKINFALLKRALQLTHKMKMYKMLTQS